VYGFRSWAAVLFILSLSFLDAILTALQIWSGKVEEANPLMSFTISRGGIITFFSIKAAMTALPLALLIVHKEWKIARFAVWACLSCYVVVLLYHVYLIIVHGSIALLGIWR
jgi:hypothetical protein